jgi:hypothetical protein
MNFTEGSKYLLEQSIFNRHILEVTYVDNTTAYLKVAVGGQETLTDYRYSAKSGKMHKWNKAMQTWDLVEDYTLTEYGSNSIYESVNVC